MRSRPEKPVIAALAVIFAACAVAQTVIEVGIQSTAHTMQILYGKGSQAGAAASGCHARRHCAHRRTAFPVLLSKLQPQVADGLVVVKLRIGSTGSNGRAVAQAAGLLSAGLAPVPSGMPLPPPPLPAPARASLQSVPAPASNASTALYAILDGTSVAQKVAQLQAIPCEGRREGSMEQRSTAQLSPAVASCPGEKGTRPRRQPSHLDPSPLPKLPPAVEYAEPLYRRYLLQAPAARLPDDPYLGKQWWVQAASAGQAWAITTGSASVKVCTVDTGANRYHEDLGNGGKGTGSGWDPVV